MNENILLAIVVCAFFAFASIAVVTGMESEHEKIMNKIEEKKAILELEETGRYKQLLRELDSLSLEVDKR